MEKNEYPKVLIGVVTSVHKIYCLPQFLKGIMNIDYPNKEILLVDNSPDEEAPNYVRSIEEAGFRIVHIPRATYTRQAIVDSRNFIRDYFLKDEEFEWFLSLEADVIPPKDVIQRLMESKKDVVSAVYLNGKIFEGVKNPNTGRDGEVHTWIPMAWDYPEEGMENLSVLKPMEVLQDIVPSNIYKVQSSGLGCVLISKDVLKKLGGFRYEKKAVACDDMYYSMDVTRMCTNKQCDFGVLENREKYGYKMIGMKDPETGEMFKCPKCKSEGHYNVWLNSYIWCKHLHKEWTGDAKLKR